eukprot:COSAG05_NODE_2297_length_3261_cov_16.226123_2_plen_65_part_00
MAKLSECEAHGGGRKCVDKSAGAVDTLHVTCQSLSIVKYYQDSNTAELPIYWNGLSAPRNRVPL